MEQTLRPSENLYRPIDGSLVSCTKSSRLSENIRAAQVGRELHRFFSRKDYPCVAGLHAFKKGEFQVGFYGRLGTGDHGRQLRNDLIYFASEQERKKSIYLTFFAIFDEGDCTEAEFETKLWQELSSLTSFETFDQDFKPGDGADPKSPAFRFSLLKREYFVVGLYPQSSRKARRFIKPALVFNLFAQFEELQSRGAYEGPVKTIRSRELKFEGSVNPMVQAHGESWESI